MHDPVSLGANPESTVAIAENSSGSQGRWRALEGIIHEFSACELINAVDGQHRTCPMIAWREGLGVWDWSCKIACGRTGIPSPYPCRGPHPQIAVRIFI